MTPAPTTHKPLSAYKKKIPASVYAFLEKRKLEQLRPAQWKAIDKGLFDDKNMLVCTPTASGKTLVAELAILNAIYHDRGICVYIVPLRALAAEKFKQFKRWHDPSSPPLPKQSNPESPTAPEQPQKTMTPPFKIALTSGDVDSDDSYLGQYSLIITTSEKFDSLLRHKASWLSRVKVVIIDEIHLLNDTSRGPTLEVVITLLRSMLKNLQLIGLSATIGNPKELARWLGAELVEDKWRPVRLDKGIYLDGEVEFY